jgi:hypothetical protein
MPTFPDISTSFVSLSRSDLNDFASSLLLPIQASAPTPASTPVPALLPPRPVSRHNSYHPVQYKNNTSIDNTKDNSKSHTNTTQATFTAFELFTLERLQKRNNFTRMECIAVVEGMHTLRKLLRKPTSSSTSATAQFVIVGFAPVSQRNLFLRALRYATRAKVIYSAYVEPGSVLSKDLQRFEVFVRASIATLPALENPLRHDTEVILEYLQHWKLSLCCIDLSSCCVDDEALLTCIDRLEMGRQPYGNWNCNHNFDFRQSIRANIIARDERRARQHVLQQTGYEFTPSNMLRTFYDLQNARIDMSSFQYGVQNIRTHLMSLLQSIDNQNNLVDRENGRNSPNTENIIQSNMDDITPTLRTILQDPIWSNLTSAQATSHLTILVDLTEDTDVSTVTYAT